MSAGMASIEAVTPEGMMYVTDVFAAVLSATRQPHFICNYMGVCRRPIKMSPLCQLQMTLPGGFPGGVRGDGSFDERWGAVAA
jgi:hypothetical protein